MQKSFEHFSEKCIDDDNLDNAKGLIEDMRKILKYVGCKNIIEFVSNKRKYNLKPPLYLDDLNNMLLLEDNPKGDIIVTFNCKNCNSTNNVLINNILRKRITGVNGCQGCKTIVNYNKIMDRFSLDEIHSIRKAGTI